jgi:hypothetical protein
MLHKATLTEEKKHYFKGILTQTLGGLWSEKEKNPRSTSRFKDDLGDFIDRASPGD